MVALHDHLAVRFAARDRLVYLGNYLGQASRDNASVIDELLAFRAAMLTRSGMEPNDIIHLRGPSEEAWERLLRLHFTPVPAHALESLLAAGVEAYLRLYGASVNDARAISRAGNVSIAHWTNQLRLAQRATDGREALACSMRRAAIAASAEDSSQRILCVPAGFDAGRSLEDQGESLWYNTSSFRGIQSEIEREQAAFQYARIVRGFDASRGGVSTEGRMVTLDGGCGRGGPLVCGCFSPSGRLIEIIAIGGRGAIESLPLDDKNRASAQMPEGLSSLVSPFVEPLAAAV